MTVQTSTLRPGLLVSLKTSVAGNVSYSKEIIEPDHVEAETGAKKARWETARTIVDPVEHENAIKARGRARSVIRAVCTDSAFGLLCPEVDGDKLAAAVAEARAIADAFNSTATLTRVHVYVITGRVAADDVEAVKAINSEVRDLMEEMQSGISKLDADAVRKAASRAKEIGSMLSADAQARVQIAVDTARAAAKRIVQAGETAAAEIDQSALRKITEMRTAFLDLDAAGEIKAPAASAAALDLSPAKPGGPVTFAQMSMPAEVD